MSARPGHKHAYDDAASAPEVPTHAPAPFVMTDALATQSTISHAGLVPVAGWIAGEDSSLARRICIRRREDDRLMATAIVTPAEGSTLLAPIGVDARALSKCLMIS